jgi:hypothetical protein
MFAFLFILPTKMAYVDLWVGIKEGILASHDIARSKTGPQGDASHILGSRRASVWNFYKLPNSKIFLYSNVHDSLSFEEMPFI